MANAGRSNAAQQGQDELDEAFEKLQQETPDFVTRTICRLRKPQARLVRIPLGILFICAGFLWFLPALGLWCLPIGLLLVAQDVPFLRRPVGRMTLYLLDRWVASAQMVGAKARERPRRKSNCGIGCVALASGA